jgi:hypothetical protein
LNLKANYWYVSDPNNPTRQTPYYLEEAELVRGLVRSDDQGFDVPNIDVAASNGERWRARLGGRFEHSARRGARGLTEIRILLEVAQLLSSGMASPSCQPYDPALAERDEARGTHLGDSEDGLVRHRCSSLMYAR